MNAGSRVDRFLTGPWRIIAVGATTLVAIAVSFYYLNAGEFFVFQNIFYFPIIIACLYYLKRGFVFSLLLAFLYLFLMTSYTADFTLIREAMIRVVLFILVAGVVTFISFQRREAQLALRESEERYRTMVENTRDLIYTTDRKGFLTYVNPMLEKTMGYAEGELLGKSFADLIAPDHVERLKDIFKRAMRGETFPVYEADLIRKDGTVFSVEFNTATICDSEGQPAGRHGIGRDTTDRKRTEDALRQNHEKFRFLTETMSDIVWTLDMNFRTTYVSPSIYKVLGFTPEERMAQEPSEIMTPESFVRIAEALAAEMDKDQRGEGDPDRSIAVEVEYYHKDGHLVWLENLVHGIRDGNGNVVALHGVSRDITKRKRAEEALLKAYQDLQEAKDMLVQTEKMAAMGQLAAGADHEIRNPLHIMSLRVEMMEMKEDLPEDMRKVLDIIKLQINRIVRILEGLRDFSRMPQIKTVPSSLNGLVRRVLALNVRRLATDNITVETRYEEDLPPTLLDTDMMEGVLTGLISNAADAMQGRGNKLLRVTTRLIESKEHERWIQMVLSDTGLGIRSEDLSRIFDPFFTTKGPDKGTGLGLSIAYRIIQGHGGRIWAENNEGEGASIYIDLPVKETSAS